MTHWLGGASVISSRDDEFSTKRSFRNFESVDFRRRVSRSSVVDTSEEFPTLAFDV
jgi:hypothetical protein